MKRSYWVLPLCTALLCGTLCGCQKEEKPLRILVDGISHILLEEQLPRIRGNGFSAEYEIEYVPNHTFAGITDTVGSGEDREMALSRLRTEIMAGNGPDVYLCVIPNVREQANYDVEALFPYPEKAALNGSFLPLDGYLETAGHMEWDRFEKAVTDGGKNQLGQCILPMNYTFHVSVFRAEDLTGDYSQPMTYSQMLESDDPVLLASAAEDYNDFDFGDSLGAYADYQHDALTFTEEELFQRVRDSFTLLRESGMTLGDDNIINSSFDTPRHSSLYFGFPNMAYCTADNYEVWRGNTMVSTPIPVNLRREEEKAVMIPLYNDQGGVTANITAWAAVDAHTKRPKEAFSFLDALFSTPVMQSALFGGNPGISVHSDLGTKWKQAPGAGAVDGMWYASDENWPELERVRAQINAVKFYTPLDAELYLLRRQFYLQEGDEGDVDAMRDAVRESCRAMQKMLGES